MLAFVRNGYVYLNLGQAGVIGENGYRWSRTVWSSTNAYNLSMYPTTILPSGDYTRYYGFPLRCLYPGSA